ncbi:MULTISPECIES: hypothetical protein [unclassified Streptomyces]|uniref:hypothetical protein n=1 Tax=unclassified Streptomyces TaxID=2593676 RepID=UPI00070DEE4B|nr:MULTISPECIES: hypothetical protein [unclassified Streptomyces]KRC95696.1 hypothetical protein ASE41_08100 [Streptomyces sp. Root264]
MKRSSGARLCATAAIGALSLSLLTACSDGGSKDTADSKTSASSSAASSQAPAAKALTKAELEKLLLAQGELKGYKVDSGDDTLPASKNVVKTDKPACDPLAWATAALAPGDTDASVGNTVAEDKTSAATAKPTDLADAFDIDMTFVGLSSYEGDGAQKAMKAVSDGVTACAGGFGLTADSEKTKITKIAAAKGSGKGDETVAFTEEVDMDGQGRATAHAEVVRKGNTVATFYTVNFAAMAKGGDLGPVPAAVIDAQVAKLK